MNLSDPFTSLNIAAALRLALGVTLIFIRNFLFSPSRWRASIKGYLKRIWDIFWGLEGERLIAEALDMAPDDIWPSRYSDV